jgi:outer membrane lipoprotein-sorting protein
MKTIPTKSFVLSFAVLAFAFTAGSVRAAPDATELIKKSEFQTRGKSVESDMSMTVIRGTTTRNLEIKVWAEGNDKAVVKILAPAKDRDTGNLRIKFDLWQYLPNLERTIKIPPSMMLQSWMGSDFTNDDLVKTTSVSRDYTHKLLGEEVFNGMKTFKIECTPKKDAPIAWGKIIMWVRNPDAVPVKNEFYTESGELAKISIGTDLKTFGAHTVATKLSMKLPRKPDHETRIDYKDLRFDRDIPANTFTQEFLKKRAKN